MTPNTTTSQKYMHDVQVCESHQNMCQIVILWLEEPIHASFVPLLQMLSSQKSEAKLIARY